MRLFHLYRSPARLGYRCGAPLGDTDGGMLVRYARDPWFWRMQASIADVVICANCAARLRSTPLPASLLN